MDVRRLKNEKHWWHGHPWRMIQTNLREVDMEQIDAEEYAQQLADFGATVVTLNTAGILASYDTKHPYHPKSEYLHGDSLAMLVEACHKKGIRVIARTDFSKVHYDLYEQHPEWAYRTAKGEIMNYNGDVQVCPNGDYQQTVMFEILHEALTSIPFDGVFCNMSGFLVTDYSGKYYGPCHCENCVRKFKKEYGLDVPLKDDFSDPVYLKYVEFKAKITAAHKAKMKALIKGISPELCQNNLDYIRSESNTEIGRAQWQYSASSNSRLAAGHDHDRPSDNASVDFVGFRYRDISVSPALMALRQWQNLANSGCCSMYIMGKLDNHPDISGFEPTRKVFAFHKQHEKMFVNLQSAAKVLVLRQGMWQRTDPEVAGWIRALTESHVPFDEMNLAELVDEKQLASYTTVVLGDLKGSHSTAATLLNGFVQNGGSILATGETTLECLGVEQVVQRRHDAMSAMFAVSPEEAMHFPHCANTPYIAPGSSILLVKPAASASAYLHMIDEHPFGPPERCYFTAKDVTDWPGILVNRYGKGKTVYAPFKLAGFYMTEGYRNSLNLLQDVMALADVQSIAPELTAQCEVTVGKSLDKTVIQLVNTSGCFANSYFEPIPLRDIRLRLDGYSVRRATALNGGSVTVKDGVLTLDVLQEYEAIVLE